MKYLQQMFNSGNKEKRVCKLRVGIKVLDWSEEKTSADFHLKNPPTVAPRHQQH